jgi:hypothetical protein
MGTTSPPVAVSRRIPGRLCLWLGVGLVLLGPILYVVQLRMRFLSVPWYVPVLATAGVALVFVAGLREWSLWRIVAMVLCGFLAGAEWFFLVSLSKVPAYTGPVATGLAFPTFTTTLANGPTFNQDSLRGEQNSALVFFRGRW